MFEMSLEQQAGLIFIACVLFVLYVKTGGSLQKDHPVARFLSPVFLMLLGLVVVIASVIAFLNLQLLAAIAAVGSGARIIHMGNLGYKEQKKRYWGSLPSKSLWQQLNELLQRWQQDRIRAREETAG